MRGVCLESTKINFEETLPCNITTDEYPLLKEEHITAAIVFCGSTKYGNHHFLEIYKDRDTVSIKYYIRKHSIKKGKCKKQFLLIKYFIFL